MVVNHFTVSTIKAYMSAIKRLKLFHEPDPLETLTEDQLVAFICHLREGLSLSSASMRIAVGAIRYFYRFILCRPALVEIIPYPKKEKHVRAILAGTETLRLFELTVNLKHRFLLKLVYSAGLRRSELITLRPEDFDWGNRQLLVKQGKGRKDRYTVLATSLRPDFDKYMQQYSPDGFLFYGRDRNLPLNENATRWIINQAVARAGITKPGICLHSLRHSFASHLLAMHTDVVTVQKLMGHDDIRTTMGYFHLGNRPNPGPKSPLDILYP